MLYIQLKPYESKLSTALSERKAVARCATRKTDTAINRIKTVGAHKLRNENTYIVNRIKTVGACKTVDCNILYKVQIERKHYYNVLHLYGLRGFFNVFILFIARLLA